MCSYDIVVVERYACVHGKAGGGEGELGVQVIDDGGGEACSGNVSSTWMWRCGPSGARGEFPAWRRCAWAAGGEWQGARRRRFCACFVVALGVTRDVRSVVESVGA
jgi:hypothetical protein